VIRFLPILLLLSACSVSDEDMQVTSCRKALTAITGEARLRELRVQPLEHAVRIEYLLEADQTRARFIACRSEAGLPTQIMTERGRMGEGQIYALQRYGMRD